MFQAFIFLEKSSDYENRFSGVNPSALLTKQDFVDIKNLARTYYEDANKVRLEKGLQSFEEIDELNKIANIHYAQKMFSYYIKFSDLLEGDLFPSDWKDTYLPKTPCVEKHIAMHNTHSDNLMIFFKFR